MISTPLIWIVLPMGAAVLLWMLRRYRLITVSLAVTLCLGLALLAWMLPFSGMLQAGPFIVEISNTLSVLGRRFVLNEGDRFLLIFLYLVGAMWFTGESVLRRNRAFAPLGLAFLALSISALAVDPFLYSALIIEVMVLISIPLLLPPGAKAGQGVMRYLVFQTIAMALILLAGWAAEGVDLNPNDTQLITQALILLGLGFIFWMAVFPFHTWVPQLAQEAFPFQAGFLLSLLPMVITLMGLDFLNGFGWLRNFGGLPVILRFAGALTVAAGGIWAAFERCLDRYLGFCLIAETGFALLALSLHNTVGYRALVAAFLPRTLVIALWSVALSSLKLGGFSMDQLAGLARHKPVESVALLVSTFSVAGLPLLGFFPIRQVLLENLAQASLLSVIWSLAGVAGLLAGSLRILMGVIGPADRPAGEPAAPSDWRGMVLLGVGMLLLLLTGLFPQWFSAPLFNLLNAFQNLV